MSENLPSEEPNPIVWTPERVKRFWTVMSHRPNAEQTYFTSIYGSSIAKWAERHAGLKSGMRVCDWGSGWGHLAFALAEAGIAVTCVDQVSSLGAPVANHPSVEFLSIQDIEGFTESPFDGAFLIETIEHLDDPALETVLSVLHRIVKPGGFLVVTTPNQEELSRNEVYCPNCNSLFHPWQHVRSVSREWLEAEAARYGWEQRFAQELEFEPPGIARFLARARTLRSRLSRPGSSRALPHLAWLGVSAGPR